MGNGKAIQHYVPQFILRNFHGDNDKQIHVFDTHDLKAYTANIRDVAAEFDFYEITINGVNISLEEALSVLETKTSTIVSKILKTKTINWISAEEKLILANFTAIQMVRTVNSKQMLIALDSLMRDFIEQGTGKPTDIPDMGKEQPTESMINLMINSEEELTRALLLKDLFLFRSSPNHPFVISDNPVIRDNNFHRSNVRGTAGLNCKGVEIFLPISPDLGLAFLCNSIFDEMENGLKKAKKFKQLGIQFDLEAVDRMYNSMLNLETLDCIDANVDYYNSLQLYNAERRIFSSQSDFSEYIDQINETPELKNPYRLAVK